MQGLIVVTGAASGIGLALSELLLQRHENVVLGAIDLNADALATLSDAYPGRVRHAACDVGDQTAAHAAVDAVAAGETMRGLVCCAGILRSEPSIDMSAANWHQMLGVHLDGSFFVAQAAARHMIAAGSGSIVFFASVAMDFAWPRRLPYAVAKAGTGALTRTLAMEWAEHNIRVNALAPGYVETPMIIEGVRVGAFDGEARKAQHALKRFARPEEIAETAEFLLSDRASFITGEVLRVDGGFSITS